MSTTIRTYGVIYITQADKLITIFNNTIVPPLVNAPAKWVSSEDDTCKGSEMLTNRNLFLFVAFNRPNYSN